jgi:hypothetical protein
MSRRSPLVKWLLLFIGAAILLAVLFTVAAILLQTNPPIVKEPTWDSPSTRALAKRACFDCHSNETTYPWYDKLPVSSWITVFDVVRGRRELNFSEWRSGRRTERLAREVENGSMPPPAYILLHPEAKLNEQEKQQLIQGLQNLR